MAYKTHKCIMQEDQGKDNKRDDYAINNQL